MDWQQDLAFLAEQLRTRHANVYHTVTAEQFDLAIRSLHERIPLLPRHQIVVEMARIVAMVGDGHTSLWLGENVGFREYPLRFYHFSDGVFVTEANQENRDVLGLRLVEIEGKPIEAVLLIIEPVVSGDNRVMKKLGICAYMSVAEVLHALGITASMDSAEFTFEDETGKRLTRRFVPSNAERTRLCDNETPLALWLRNPDKLYWYEYLEAHNTVYFHHRVVRNADDETIATFCERLFAFIDTNPVERLIIDLRNNGGGDNRLNQPLVHGLICCKQVNQEGRLFTIVGRRTFSAAMNLAVDLERNTKTLFVGEPTGASPNHYGETTVVTLPLSGITFILSALYWQSAGPFDKRLWVEPQIPAELSSSDFRHNVDPALDKILAYPLR